MLFPHIFFQPASLRRAVFSLHSSECFQEKWGKHLLKVRAQAPPLLAVHSEGVVVFRLARWSSLTVQACALTYLHADVCFWQRGTRTYLLPRYIRVQWIQSSCTWTPWHYIDTMCRLSASHSSHAAAVFWTEKQLPRWHLTQRSPGPKFECEICSKEPQSGSGSSFPSPSLSSKLKLNSSSDKRDDRPVFMRGTSLRLHNRDFSMKPHKQHKVKSRQLLCLKKKNIYSF